MDITTDNSIFRNIPAGLWSNRRRLLALRMAPMIDIIFLLLIFFLVSAKWRPQEDFLPLQVTSANTFGRNIPAPEPLFIHIYPLDDGCGINIGHLTGVQLKDENIQAGLQMLAEEITNCLQAQKRFTTDPVEIVCEPSVKWDHLEKIYNILCGRQLTNITFQMTEQSQ